MAGREFGGDLWDQPSGRDQLLRLHALASDHSASSSLSTTAVKKIREQRPTFNGELLIKLCSHHHRVSCVGPMYENGCFAQETIKLSLVWEMIL